jgi:septum formation protein
MQLQSHNSKLILASSSPYRKLLLEQLDIPFVTCPPDVDESALSGEDAAALVRRLAMKKGVFVAQQFPDAVVIGSDQLAECNGQVVGKPGSVSKAIAQLHLFSNQTVIFRTAIAVLCRASGFLFESTVVTDVGFRRLEDDEIRRYVAADNPIDCAGSFKSESLGISLLNHMTSTDPTAIVGLPLISLSKALRKTGISLP